jgi:hypothetical protein
LTRKNLDAQIVLFEPFLLLFVERANGFET